MAEQRLLFVSLVFLLATVSCTKGKTTHPPLPPAGGEIVLDEQGTGGGACRIQSKTPYVVVIKAGEMFVWNVKNNCDEPVTLAMFDKKQKQGNNSPVEDPLSSFMQSPQPFPPNTTGTVAVTAKTKAVLNPGGGNPGNRRWTFIWTVNCRPQNDPEIEIEGI
jgi:hypothetical protein